MEWSVLRKSPVGPWQREVDRGALSDGSFGPGSAPVPEHDSANIGETDARALEFRLRMEALEYSKELVDILHVEADSVVTDEERVFACRRVAEGSDLYARMLGL